MNMAHSRTAEPTTKEAGRTTGNMPLARVARPRTGARLRANAPGARRRAACSAGRCRPRARIARIASACITGYSHSQTQQSRVPLRPNDRQNGRRRVQQQIFNRRICRHNRSQYALCICISPEPQGILIGKLAFWRPPADCFQLKARQRGGVRSWLNWSSPNGAVGSARAQSARGRRACLLGKDESCLRAPARPV